MDYSIGRLCNVYTDPAWFFDYYDGNYLCFFFLIFHLIFSKSICTSDDGKSLHENCYSFFKDIQKISKYTYALLWNLYFSP